MASAGVSTGMRVDGARQLRASLKRAGADMSDFTQLNRKVAGVVLPAARSRAPIGPAAAGHIVDTTRVGATKSAAIVRVGNNTTKRYAAVIHWGWHRRHIKPNPWLSRAAQATEPTWSAVMFDGITTIVKKIEGS